MRDRSRPGDYYVIDTRTGFKRWASDTVRESTGLRVEDADPDHPQDFVRGRKDRQRVPFARPVPTAVFVDGEFDGSFSSAFDRYGIFEV